MNIKVFVNVKFLNYPSEELETPLSLVKREPNKKYSFNFQRGFNFILFYLMDSIDLLISDSFERNFEWRITTRIQYYYFRKSY